MSTITLDRMEWNRWKAQLWSLTDAPTVSSDSVRACLQTLSLMEEEQLPNSAPRDCDDRPSVSASALPSPATLAPVRKDATTQLCTVHPIHYTHHLLNKVKYQRQVRRLSTRLGHLAADLYAVADSLWRLLVYIHGRSTAHRSTEANKLRRGVNVSSGNAPTASDTPQCAFSAASCASSSLISTEAHRILLSLLAKSVDFDPSLLTSFASRTFADEVGHVDASTQASAEEDDGVSGVGQRQRQPFLCRRCRQDGRTAYEYDKEKQRLRCARPVPAARAAAPAAPTQDPPRSTQTVVVVRGAGSRQQQHQHLAATAPKHGSHLPNLRR